MHGDNNTAARDRDGRHGKSKKDQGKVRSARKRNPRNLKGRHG